MALHLVLHMLALLMGATLLVLGLVSLRTGWLLPWLRNSQNPRAWGWFAVLFAGAMLLQVGPLPLHLQELAGWITSIISLVLIGVALVIWLRRTPPLRPTDPTRSSLASDEKPNPNRPPEE